jgi:tubulin polyglutamylase TTLL1
MFVKDYRFSEFLAVDFLLDDSLRIWVLEVNFNPQILSVTPDRIKRNYKMIDVFVI